MPYKFIWHFISINKTMLKIHKCMRVQITPHYRDKYPEFRVSDLIFPEHLLLIESIDVVSSLIDQYPVKLIRTFLKKNGQIGTLQVECFGGLSRVSTHQFWNEYNYRRKMLTSKFVENAEKKRKRLVELELNKEKYFISTLKRTIRV